MIVGTHLRRIVFGFSDRSFIDAVRLAHEMVMALAVTIASALVALAAASQFAVPPHLTEVATGVLHAVRPANLPSATASRLLGAVLPMKVAAGGERGGHLGGQEVMESD
jgi:hypothetical protein